MSVNQQNPDHKPHCAEVGEQLSAYLDGELCASDAEAVEAHLRECPECARLCAALRALRAELAEAQLDPPPTLHTRVMATVRKENRLRKLRRFTVAASAGLAAMFCFVVVGGAMMRPGTADNAAMEMADAAKAMQVNEEIDGMHMYAMTGAVIDTTLELAPPIVGTGLDSQEPERGPIMQSPAPSKSDNNETRTPETASAEKSAAAGVIAVQLPETLRDLSRLSGRIGYQGASTTGASAESAPADRAGSDGLAALFDDPDARLAEEQLGTLCTVEVEGANGRQIFVFDLITGERLTLADFLGSADAVAALEAEADTPYRPTAAGLCLLLPTGERCIPWDANPTLAACVSCYAMTKAPLCGVN